jgi:hypothetical protein
MVNVCDDGNIPDISTSLCHCVTFLPAWQNKTRHLAGFQFRLDTYFTKYIPWNFSLLQLVYTGAIHDRSPCSADTGLLAALWIN